jgi:hypothetical protein
MDTVTRCGLITNLGAVTIGDIRTYTHALLLIDTKGCDMARNGRFAARGFATEAGEPTFDMRLPSIDYTFELEPVPDFIKNTGGQVLSTRGTLHVKNTGGDPINDVSMVLACGSFDGRPIDFETFAGDDRDGRFYPSLWNRLQAKVAHYWDAPYIMLRRQARIEEVRGALEVNLRCGNSMLVIKGAS